MGGLTGGLTDNVFKQLYAAMSLTTMTMKFAAFWFVTPFILVEFTDVSEEYATFFRAETSQKTLVLTLCYLISLLLRLDKLGSTVGTS
jgi:hypothetical protein